MNAPAAVGVYRHAGDILVIREFTPRGESHKVRYARKIVALRPGQAERLNGAGAAVRYEEAKAPGMQYRLTPAELLSVAEVEALSLEWGKCIVCGLSLRVEKSIKRGIGPVCFGRQSAALSGAA